MTKLTDVQKKLAEQLLLSVKNHEMNVEYNELRHESSLLYIGDRWGRT